jgi:hypothetical protein
MSDPSKRIDKCLAIIPGAEVMGAIADITYMRVSQTAKPPVAQAEAAISLSVTGRILRRASCDAEI